MKRPGSMHKNILVSAGFLHNFPARELLNERVKIFVFTDHDHPFDLVKDTSGASLLSYKRKPLLKNGKPAIPYLKRVKAREGDIRPVYLTDEKSLLGVDEIDLFIPFINIKSLDKQIAFLEFIESHQIKTVETSDTFKTCMNKCDTYEKLSNFGLPQPLSVPLFKESALEKNLQAALKFYVQERGNILLKPATSTIGRGIETNVSIAVLKDKIEENIKQGKHLLLQKKIDIPKPLHHIRVAIAYGKIIAAQKFVCREGCKTSHVGYHTNVIDMSLDQERIDICLNTAQVLGANLCSLDCLVSTDNKFYVLEANIMPVINKFFPEQAGEMVHAIQEKHCL